MQLSRLIFLSVLIMLFFGNTLYAKELVLKASEVSTLLTDATVLVTHAGASKDESEPFKVYFGEQGLIEVKSSEGGEQNRAWSINDDGRLCISRSFSRRRGGATCGYLVTTLGTGVYTMYKAKGVEVEGERAVSARQAKPILVFSKFVAGNQL